MLKKCLSIVLTFAFLLVSIFSGVQSASAQASTSKSNSVECPLCTIDEGKDEKEVLNDAIEQLKEDGTTTNMNVSIKEKKEIDNITAKKDKEFKRQLDLVQKDGFVYQDQANTYITFKNLKDKDVVYDKVGVTIQFFVKNGGKDVVEKQVWTNLKTKSIIRYDVIKIENGDSEEPNVSEVASYDINAKNTDTGDFQTAAKKFNFNGISFTCSVAGVVACAAAFGGLTVYFPLAGAALSLGCVMAFNTGCAYT